MPENREPWIKLKIGIRRSDKMASLPSDNAWRGWIYVLLEAKTQRRMGVFVNRAHLVDLLGAYGQHVDAFVDVGLLHIAPALCAECAPRHAHDELRTGELVVHDYLREQRDPTNAERQAAYRDKQRLDRVTADVTAQPVTQSPSTADVPPPTPRPVTAASVTPEAGQARITPNVTPPSRARGTTATVTTTGTTKKNVSDGEGEGTTADPTREPVEAPFLSDPNRAGRPSASPGPVPRPALAMPAGLAAVTPQWRHACTDYTRHQSKHRIVDGVAVCDPCEEALAAATAAKPNGELRAPQDGFGLA